MNPQPELRIGDAEREAAVAALGEHYAAGRLSKEEYDERADLAWAAKTRSALWPLFADLPRPQATGSHPGGPAPGWGGSSWAPRREPDWWAGARLLPLVVLVALLALTALKPGVLLLVLGCVLFVKMSRHRGHAHHHRSSHGYHDGPPYGPPPRGWLR